jgi:lysophospholipase L1-like esterase
MKQTGMRFVVACVLALVVASPALAAERFNPPKQYYLALGDSLTFGYQQQKIEDELKAGTYKPSNFAGFVVPFSNRLLALRPSLSTINYGCPGETTVTFINGGCPFLQVASPPPSLHNSYGAATSQLQAALTYLRQHPGKVSPITVSLGANDALGTLQICGTPESCDAYVPALTQQISTNLDRVLGDLRRSSPSSEIIVVNLYDPYAPTFQPIVDTLNQAIGNVAKANDARVADVSQLVTDDVSRCTNTLLCTSAHDIHPTDAGYALMAGRVWAASGYDRLDRP